MTKFLWSFLILIVLLISAFFFFMDYGPVYVLPVLRYEHIAESGAKELNHVHPQTFSSQIKSLADDKMNVISLEEVVKIYREGGKIPQRTLAITFDGGYDDFFENAYNVLAKFKFPATVFIQSSNLGKKGYLTKEQVEKMKESGLITIGANGQFGKDLTRMGGGESYGEIASSRSSLQKELEVVVNYFSYPNGGVNAGLIQMVRDSRYKGACAILPGNKYSNRDPFVIKRMWITPSDDNPILFKLKTWGNYALYEEWRMSRKAKNKN